jgi:acetyl-CoA carboxylase carboxyltransferase component
MKLAEKFRRPLVTLIDTPGAYPGIGAEERGQGEAIARNLREMAGLRIPSVAVVIGEGGSGGALAIGVADRVLMLENSIYSVISPEGCAAILWKSGAERDKAAQAMKITAGDLKGLEDRRHRPRAGRRRAQQLGRHGGGAQGRPAAAPGRAARHPGGRAAARPLGQVHGDGRVARRALTRSPTR